LLPSARAAERKYQGLLKTDGEIFRPGDAIGVEIDVVPLSDSRLTGVDLELTYEWNRLGTRPSGGGGIGSLFSPPEVALDPWHTTVVGTAHLSAEDFVCGRGRSVFSIPEGAPPNLLDAVKWMIRTHCDRRLAPDHHETVALTVVGPGPDEARRPHRPSEAERPEWLTRVPPNLDLGLYHRSSIVSGPDRRTDIALEVAEERAEPGAVLTGKLIVNPEPVTPHAKPRRSGQKSRGAEAADEKVAQNVTIDGIYVALEYWRAMVGWRGEPNELTDGCQFILQIEEKVSESRTLTGGHTYEIPFEIEVPIAATPSFVPSNGSHLDEFRWRLVARIAASEDGDRHGVVTQGLLRSPLWAAKEVFITGPAPPV
jgi:hypothetical protein